MKKRPIDRLRELIERQGASAVLDRCVMTKKATVYGIAADRPDSRNPTLDTVQDIVENGCGLTMSEFFHDPDAPDEDAALWEEFRACLSDDRRETVEIFLKSLAKWPKGVARKRAPRSA